MQLNSRSFPLDRGDAMMKVKKATYYINAGPYMNKEEVAYYLDTDTKTWQYTNCKSSYVAEQGTITYGPEE